MLTQSFLTLVYFEKLIPAATNKYVKFNTYDESQPIITQMYENVVSSTNQISNNDVACEKTHNEYIISSMWKKYFPKNSPHEKRVKENLAAIEKER